MVCRLNVNKNTKGNGFLFEPEHMNLLPVFDVKKKDYLIFRSIGASKKDLNRVTEIELIYLVMIAFVLVIAFVYINDTYLFWIPGYLRFFEPINYVVIVLMLVALALLLAFRFNRKLFSGSVITSLKQE